MTNETITVCKDCGKENIKNMGSHKRYCKKTNGLAMTPGVENQDSTIPSPTGKQEEPVISITDITPCDYNEVAWYTTPEGQTSKQIGSIGILHTEKGENIPCALVMSPNGVLMPAFMLEGFLGMHNDGMCIPVADNDDEPFPPFAETIDEPAHVEDAQPIEAPKRSILSKVFGKKVEQSKVSDETQDLIKGVINAS